MTLSWLRQLWTRLLADPSPDAPPFVVACRCGRALSTTRQATHQALRCPACGRAIFVLPRAAFRPPGHQPTGRPRSDRPRSALWLLVPAVAMGLLGMGIVYGLARWLESGDPAGTVAEATPRQRLLQTIEAGRGELDRGATHLAREILDRAVGQRDADPALLTEAEHRALNQVQREAALLTDLAPVSLLAMLDQAEKAASLAAWQARFRADYQGRAVLFDDVFRQDRDRKVHGRRLDDLRTGQSFGRVALDDLALVGQLPLQVPQRWIVGARLKSIEREGSPAWVVRLEPDSGVLMAERVPLEAEVPSLRDDPEWPLLRTRQQGLLDALPAPKPHRP